MNGYTHLSNLSEAKYEELTSEVLKSPTTYRLWHLRSSKKQCLRQLLNSPYPSNGFERDGNCERAQNIEANTHARINTCTYSFSVFVKKFDLNDKLNASAMFRKVPHYKILQKAAQLFVVVTCACAERTISIGATQDANDSR